jgi:hypothetical protein
MMKSKTRAILALFISLNFLLSFQAAFSNTQYVEFTIYIDRTAPAYSNEIMAGEISQSGDSINVSSFWSDNHKLSNYYYESNITGSYENSALNSFNEGYSNETVAVTDADYEGRSVYYRFIGFDLAGNANSTEYKSFSILSQNPQFSNVSQSADEITQGSNITLSAYWTDNFNAKNATLQINNGSWEDKETLALNSQSSWSNFTFNTAGLSGSIGWKIKSYDNIGNFNLTTAMSFIASE